MTSTFEELVPFVDKTAAFEESILVLDNMALVETARCFGMVRGAFSSLVYESRKGLKVGKTGEVSSAG